MIDSDSQRPSHSLVRSVGCFGSLVIMMAGIPYGLYQLRQLADRNLAQQQAVRLQRQFVLIQQGNSRALVSESKLIAMLASDPKCRNNVTCLEFASTNIDATDAKYVAQLKNVNTLTFYCTSGTKELLLAARTLPVKEIYFEMPDLADESYLVLRDFPSLERVQIEHRMQENWIKRLESELPNVTIVTPLTQANQAASGR